VKGFPQRLGLKMEQESKDTVCYNKVLELLLSRKTGLPHTEEDAEKIKKLWDGYFKKRKNISRTSAKAWAASVLWQYSRLNFLWEHDKKWAQKSIGTLFGVQPKAIGDKCREITALLKIKDWDDRFCRKSVAESNPLKDMVMLPSGFILTREQAASKGIPFMPLKKTKEDYLYEGMEYIGEDDTRAIRLFKKALEMDDEYIDAYNGIGNVYFWQNAAKAKENYQKAYSLTLKRFKGNLPVRLEWGILENRQYLRAMHGHGLLLWRENKSGEAMEIFKLMLKLNPGDNQGIRYLVAAIYEGLSWEKMPDFDEGQEKLEKMFVRQNKKHGFFRWKE